MKLPDTIQRGVHLGYLAGLGAALCYAASNLIAKKIVSDYSSPTVGTALSMSFGTIILATLFYRDVARDALTAPRRAWVFVALAGIAATWGVSFLFLAVSQAPVVLVAPLTGTQSSGRYSADPLLSTAPGEGDLEDRGRRLDGGGRSYSDSPWQSVNSRYRRLEGLSTPNPRPGGCCVLHSPTEHRVAYPACGDLATSTKVTESGHQTSTLHRTKGKR